MAREWIRKCFIYLPRYVRRKNSAGVNGGSTMCNPGPRTTIAASGNLLILLFIHHFVLLIIKETSCVSDHKRKVYNSQQPQEKLCWILSHYRNFLLSQQDYIFQSHTVIDLVKQQDHSSRNICISDSVYDKLINQNQIKISLNLTKQFLEWIKYI